MAVCRWTSAFILLSINADVPNVSKIDMVVPSKLVRNPLPQGARLLLALKCIIYCLYFH